MTSRRRPSVVAVLLAAALLAGCRSDDDPTGSSADVTNPPADTVTSEVPDEDAPPIESTVPSTVTPDSSGTPSTPPTGDPEPDPEPPATEPPPTEPAPTEPPVTEPEPPPIDLEELAAESAEVIVLSDSYSDGGDTWGDGGTWEVDVPGEASATVLDGAGVMETDRRGTHEWVRAITPESVHVDATLLARIEPIESEEGTVFVTMRGDGEWRDNASYLPQTGLVLEYSYAEVFEGEVTLMIADGPELRRIGPAPGPVLSDGESADIRFDVTGERARVKVWRSSDPEPEGWTIDALFGPSPDGGVVQISYRDGVAQSVAWDTLVLLTAT